MASLAYRAEEEVVSQNDLFIIAIRKYLLVAAKADRPAPRLRVSRGAAEEFFEAEWEGVVGEDGGAVGGGVVGGVVVGAILYAAGGVKVPEYDEVGDERNGDEDSEDTEEGAEDQDGNQRHQHGEFDGEFHHEGRDAVTLDGPDKEKHCDDIRKAFRSGDEGDQECRGRGHNRADVGYEFAQSGEETEEGSSGDSAEHQPKAGKNGGAGDIGCRCHRPSAMGFGDIVEKTGGVEARVSGKECADHFQMVRAVDQHIENEKEHNDEPTQYAEAGHGVGQDGGDGRGDGVNGLGEVEISQESGNAVVGLLEMIDEGVNFLGGAIEIR